jgi:hypothetical protein
MAAIAKQQEERMDTFHPHGEFVADSHIFGIIAKISAIALFAFFGRRQGTA